MEEDIARIEMAIEQLEWFLKNMNRVGIEKDIKFLINSYKEDLNRLNLNESTTL